MTRVLGYNILKNGYGRESLIAEVLRSAAPDVVILEEARNPATVAKLAQLAGFPHYGAQNGCSVAFLSKPPPQSATWHENKMSRTPFLEVVTVDGLRIFGVHLYALLTNRAERWRVGEIEALISLTSQYAHEPHLLIGDFNAIAPGDNIDMASMPLWLRGVIRLNGAAVRRDALGTLIKAGYADVFRTLHPDDPGYSLPTPSPNSRLDYVFTRQANLNRVQECRILREPDAVNRASDHYPILVEVENP